MVQVARGPKRHVARGIHSAASVDHTHNGAVWLRVVKHNGWVQTESSGGNHPQRHSCCGSRRRCGALWAIGSDPAGNLVHPLALVASQNTQPYRRHILP